MMRTLLAEEIRTLGTVHAKTVGILVVAGAGALAVGLITNAMSADVPTLIAVVGAGATFLLPAPIIFVHGLSQYWQSVHGQRGYLTMSLSARGRDVFGGKVLYLLGATLAGLAVTVVGLAVVVLVRAWMTGTSPAGVWERVLTFLDIVGPSVAWTVVSVAVLQILCWVVMWASVMSIAAQTRWNHLGVTGVVVGMGALYLACQVLYAAAIILLPVGMDMSTGDLVARSMLPDLLSGTEPTVLGLGFVPAGILVSAAVAWWAVHALEHHASLR